HTRGGGRARLVRRGQRARLRGLDAPAELVEFDQPKIGRTRLALIAPAIFQHHEAVAIGLFDELPGGRDGGGILRIVDRMEEYVADAPVDGIDAFDIDDDAGALEFTKESGREDRN